MLVLFLNAVTEQVSMRVNTVRNTGTSRPPAKHSGVVSHRFGPSISVRVFDKNSAGENSRYLMGSQMTFGEIQDIKVDLLSIDNKRATIFLLQHLEGSYP